METKEILIYPNLKRVRLFFFSGFVFFLLAALFAWLGIYFWTIFLVFLGVFNFFFNYGKAFNNEALLKIDDTGIEDNMNFPKLGKIEWQNIKYAEISDLIGFDTIFVYLKEPEKFISQKSFLMRPILNSNLKNYNCCIMFRCNVFPEKAEKVVDLINTLAKIKEE